MWRNKASRFNKVIKWARSSSLELRNVAGKMTRDRLTSNLSVNSKAWARNLRLSIQSHQCMRPHVSNSWNSRKTNRSSGDKYFPLTRKIGHPRRNNNWSYRKLFHRQTLDEALWKSVNVFYRSVAHVSNSLLICHSRPSSCNSVSSNGKTDLWTQNSKYNLTIQSVLKLRIFYF